MAVIDGVSTTGSTGEMRADAAGLLTQTLTFQFVFLLVLLSHTMALTDTLSQALQKKDQDILNAMDLVKDTKDALQLMRDSSWDQILAEAVMFCQKGFKMGDEHVTIDVPTMSAIRVAPGRPRRNAHAVTNEHFFRVGLFNEFLDAQIQELNFRFSEENVEMLSLAACMSPKNSFALFNTEKIVLLASKYWPADFDAFDLFGLPHEFNLFLPAARRDPVLTAATGLVAFCKAMCDTGKHESYPLTYRLIRLILTLSVSTATGERFFSAMKIIKTRLRTTMGDDYLTNAILLYIEKGTADAITDEEIMDRFQLLATRRGEI